LAGSHPPISFIHVASSPLIQIIVIVRHFGNTCFLVAEDHPVGAEQHADKGGEVHYYGIG
jgi:hypothetical protein